SCFRRTPAAVVNIIALGATHAHAHATYSPAGTESSIPTPCSPRHVPRSGGKARGFDRVGSGNEWEGKESLECLSGGKANPEGSVNMIQCSSVLRLSLLISFLSPLSLAAYGAPAVSRPAPVRMAMPGVSLVPQALRRVVARHVVNNPNVARLIPQRPVLGGAWLVGSEHDVRFVAPGVVAIDYEDGHVAGRLVVRVLDANDPRTWVVLEDRER